MITIDSVEHGVVFGKNKKGDPFKASFYETRNWKTGTGCADIEIIDLNSALEVYNSILDRNVVTMEEPKNDPFRDELTKAVTIEVFKDDPMSDPKDSSKRIMNLVDAIMEYRK